MAVYANQIVFGTVALNITGIDVKEEQKTIKQKIGYTLVENRVFGLNDKQFRLTLSGVIYGTTSTNVSTNRAALEALNDNASHGYTDGIHTGTYILVDLEWDDSSDRVNNSFVYSMELVEE